MDKAILSENDILTLFGWRDGHIDLVRSMPAPLRGIEIICKDSGFKIKGIRDGDKLDLFLSHNGKRLGAAHFKLVWLDGKKQLASYGKQTMNATKDELQSVLTLYCSFMALMTYGRSDGNDAPKAPDALRFQQSHTQKTEKRKQSPPVTYLLRKGRSGPAVFVKGGHASPSGVFSVRGHYRHYKNGSVVWIKEYRKGTGKQRDKTYKL